MVSACQLFRLFPAAWRARYGDEFLATMGNSPLGIRNTFDILLAAIDAWLSADVRNATRAWSPATNRGGTPMLKSLLTCDRKSSGVTPRDGLIGAAVMLTVNFTFVGIAIWLHRSGWVAPAEMLKGLAFPASFTLSMPWWLMKGSPWKAQCAIVVGTLLLLIAQSWGALKM